MQPRNSCLVPRFVMLHAIKHAHDRAMHHYTLKRLKIARHKLSLAEGGAPDVPGTTGTRVAWSRTVSRRPDDVVPSMSPAHTHMQVCVILQAPRAARGAESLRMYTAHLGQLAEAKKRSTRCLNRRTRFAQPASGARPGDRGELISNARRK